MSTRLKTRRIQIEHTLSPEQVTELFGHVAEIIRTSVAESWMGGGDPADASVIERDRIRAELALAKARFDSFIARVSRHE